MKRSPKNLFQGRLIFLSAVFFIGGALNIQCSQSAYQTMKINQTNSDAASAQNDQYVGMWVTKDGYIRQELLPNGRYDEARRKNAISHAKIRAEISAFIG